MGEMGGFWAQGWKRKETGEGFPHSVIWKLGDLKLRASAMRITKVWKQAQDVLEDSGSR